MLEGMYLSLVLPLYYLFTASKFAFKHIFTDECKESTNVLLDIIGRPGFGKVKWIRVLVTC